MKMNLHPIIAIAFVLCFAILLGSLAQSKGHIKYLESQIQKRDSVNESNAWLNDSLEMYEPIVILGKCTHN